MHPPGFDRSALAYWEARSRRWIVSTPISPLPDDVHFYERCAARHAADAPLRALLLGVTPAIATMRWPKGTHLVALDWAEGMLRNVFPRASTPEHCSPLRGDWREIPIANASIDLVAGDGCYSAFADFDGPAQVNSEVARVLRPGGEFSMRCHRRLDRNAPAAELFERLFAGAIGDLDMFRWLLAMAVHGDSHTGVRLGDVWRAWNERVPDVSQAQARYGWKAQAVANMEGWRDATSRYVFPSLAQLRELAEPHFELAGCDIPGYEWGEHFPRFTWRRRAG